MTKIICDICEKERKVQKYLLPFPRKQEAKTKNGTIIATLNTGVEPHQVEMCDECATLLMKKYLIN